MLPVSRIILGACLSVLRWLMLGTAVLLVALAILRHFRGDPGATPLELMGLAAGLAGLGWLAGWGQKRLGM